MFTYISVDKIYIWRTTKGYLLKEFARVRGEKVRKIEFINL